jgi:cytochrome P450
MGAVLQQFNFPGPSPHRFLGTLPLMVKFANDSIGFTNHLFKTYGKVVSLCSKGGTNLYSPLPDCPGTIFVYGPDLVREVTNQHEIYYKHPLTGRLYPRYFSSPRKEALKHFGVGLFGVNSDEHREHRRILRPAFHKNSIESYRDTMVYITNSVLDKLQLDKLYNISEIMRILTMRIATTTLFGEDIKEKGLEMGECLQNTLHLLGLPSTKFLPYDLPGFKYRQFLNATLKLDKDIRAIINDKRNSNKGGEDLLSRLIAIRDEHGEALTEDELIGHTGVIFAAGHETSANALTWTLFLLSQHPHIELELLEELESKLKGEAPTVDQLYQLPLLDKVIKESMRILPPVPWNARVTSRDTELGGYSIPKGTEVFVSIYRTHHMEEIYEKPEEFNPYRWDKITPNSFEYNPFSAGPRMCIGAGFAITEIQIVLAMFLQRYRAECRRGLKIDRKGIIVMSPKYGMDMIIRKQDKRARREVVKVSGNIHEMVKLSANQ